MLDQLHDNFQELLLALRGDNLGSIRQSSFDRTQIAARGAHGPALIGKAEQFFKVIHGLDHRGHVELAPLGASLHRAAKRIENALEHAFGRLLEILLTALLVTGDQTLGTQAERFPLLQRPGTDIVGKGAGVFAEPVIREPLAEVA